VHDALLEMQRLETFVILGLCLFSVLQECQLQFEDAAVRMVSFWKSYELKLGSRSGGVGSRGSCLAARGSERNVCVLPLDVLSRIRRLDVVVPSGTV